METLEVIPDPVSLIESMRAVGYSVEAAIADIIDNSISAEARTVQIKYDGAISPFVAILDDGHGMSAAELTAAMRHGSSNPHNVRGPNDLGRFGLGLKTASLSQCRKLTVVSKKDGIVSARRWDLDVVRDKNQWCVVVPGAAELESLQLYSNLKSQKSGTLVVWEDLDRLVSRASDPKREITTRMSPLLEHLALVFHRFSRIEGSHHAVEIRVNGTPLPFRDPFLKSNSARQSPEGQKIPHELGMVDVQPFILPPISRLTPEEIETAGGAEGLRGTQGFYVYRGRRLVIWGTWFRLVQKQEFYKLTRVMVDIPNSFDELWSLDIKKSGAYPPDIIREELLNLIPNFVGKSKETIVYNGRRVMAGHSTPLWVRREPSHGKFCYEVNTEHPLLNNLSSDLDPAQQRHLQKLIEFIGTSVPFEAIYADMCSDRRGGKDAVDLDQLVEMARVLLELAEPDIDKVLKIDPLSRYPDKHHAIREILENV